MSDMITVINKTTNALAIGISANGGELLPLTSGSQPLMAVLPAGGSQGWAFSATPPYMVFYNIFTGAPYALGHAAPTSCFVNYVYPGATVTIGAFVMPDLPYFSAKSNLLQNPGFETGTLQPWVANPAQQVSVSGGEGYTGNYAAVLQSTGSTVTLSQDVTAPNTGRYVLAGYAKTSGIAEVTLGASVDGVEVASQTINFNNAGNAEWQPARIKFNASTGQTISVWCACNPGPNQDAGYCFLDDIFLGGPQNLIQNPSFETGKLSDWSSYGHVGIESTNPYGAGQYDCYVYPAADAPACVYQELTGPFDGAYIFTAYAQGNIPAGAQVGVNVAGAVVEALEVAANIGYAPYTISFSALKGEMIRVWCASNADSGWMTFDDCSLIVTPKSPSD